MLSGIRVEKNNQISTAMFAITVKEIYTNLDYLQNKTLVTFL